MSQDNPRYTARMPALLRAGAQMLGASGSRPAQLEDWLLLAGGSPEVVATAINAFYRWYQLHYSKLDAATNQSLFRIAREIAEEQPLFVAGLMSEFANYVDELVAVAINLGKAISVIEAKGWCQGSAHNREGHVCLLGALDYAIFTGKMAPLADYNKQFSTAVAGLSLQLGQHNIVGWNDAPGRTVNEVISLMRETMDMVLSVK